MAKLNRLLKKERIMMVAIDKLKATPSGIRYSDLIKEIHTKLPDIPTNTVHGTVWNLETRMPKEIYKPSRGLFRHTSFRDTEAGSSIIEPPSSSEKRIKEEDFYEPFAEWLVHELEECTKATALGGGKFRDKWGTPDVIGIREPRKSDIIKPPTEIVSSEIKIDTSNLISAFGQACSYRLFSHKSYIVIPGTSSQEDIARLDALCRIFGIGLILFDNANSEAPEFEIRVRATKHEPDMFYVNKYMKLIEDKLFT